ncbi:MAG: hypothetical protein IJM00_07195 [Bacteroidales bacterium]|nr:hypothetical protein [Bacteroidales bacterium]
MKKIVQILVFAALACACTPQAFTMLVEQKKLSSVGIDLSGKSVSVVYLETGNARGDAFAASFADGLAQGIEAEFYEGERSINVFSTPRDLSGNYAAKDSLVRFIMETESDVVFLVDNPAGDVSRTFLYDSMNPQDKVIRLEGEIREVNAEKNDDMYKSSAQHAGLQLSKLFQLEWEKQPIHIVYYDSSQWLQAADYAYDFQWKEAMKIWLELVKTKNVEKASCAQYDLAVGCYMLGRYQLAKEWLELSEKTCPLGISKDLMEKIEALL